MKTTIRTYSELIKFKTFEERFQYLKLSGVVGAATFGFDRYLNQQLYLSQAWKRARNHVIVRDNACDLGVDGYEIGQIVLVHHMNPLTREQVEDGCESIFEPEFLICTTQITHNGIHYGDDSFLQPKWESRKPNDTCPWRE